jgi:glucose-1-phosphate cytidylyltransferase
MKTLILAGGLGSRLAEETEIRPKPMIQIGDQPILHHIMKSYAYHGFTDFVIALGYKGEQIKKYFSDYGSLSGNLTVELGKGSVRRHDAHEDSWTVDLIETGQNAETAGRMMRARDFLGDGTFMMTYGDGVADVPLDELLRFHRAHGRLATVTAVHPVARFGQMDLDGERVRSFIEKPQLDSGWVNGGFFVLEPGVFDFIPGDCDWSRAPMEALAAADQLRAYRHEGFWQCMDTVRDRMYLQSLWDSGERPWALWNRTSAALRA